VVELAEKIESEFKERRKLNRKTKPKNPETGNGTDVAKPEVKTESDDLKNDCLKTENGDENFPGKRSACDDQGPML
jgi:hypothetical protein